MSSLKLFKNIHTIRGVFLFSIANVAVQVISLIFLPLYTHVLTPSEYGIYNYVYSLVAYLLLFSVFGVNTYLLRHYQDSEDRLFRKKVLGNSILALITTTIISYFLFGILLIFIDFKQVNETELYWFLFLALVNNLFNILRVLPLAFLRLKRDVYAYLLLNVVQTFIIQVISYSFVRFLKLGIEGRFLGEITGNAIFSIFYIQLLSKNSTFEINHFFSGIFKDILKFCFPILLSSLGFLIIDNSDRILLEHYTSINDLGIYAVALTIVFSIGFFVQGTIQAIEPELYKFSNNINGLLYVFNKYKTILIIGMALLIVSILIGKEFIYSKIISAKYSSGISVLPILIYGILFKGLFLFYNGILVSQKKTKILFYLTFIGAASSLSLNYLLIPLWGIKGAALSKTITFIIMHFVEVIIIYRILKDKFIWFKIDFIYILILAGLFIWISYSLNLLYCIIPLILFGIISYYYYRIMSKKIKSFIL